MPRLHYGTVQMDRLPDERELVDAIKECGISALSDGKAALIKVQILLASDVPSRR